MLWNAARTSAISALLTLPAAAQLPTYQPPQVRAVAAPGGLHSLGHRVQMNSSGDLLLRVWPEEFQVALWLNGELFPEPGFQRQIELANNGDLYLAARLFQNNAWTGGLWRYAPSAGPPQLLLEGEASEPLAVANAGAVTYFGVHLNAAGLVRWQPLGSATLIAQDDASGNMVERSMAQNDAGAVALMHSAGVERIWRYNTDGTRMLMVEQASSLNAQASTSINNAGQVAFRSLWALHRSDEGQVTTLALGSPNWPRDVEHFGAPQTVLSDAGAALFRAHGLDGLEGLYLADGSEVRRVAAVGDTLWTDLGPTMVTGFPTTLTNTRERCFDMTPAGDIAFIAHTSGSGVTEALVLLRVGEPCRADWNDDGAVNSADISAFLAAWVVSINDGTLDADFNADAAVNSADIGAFLTAWLQAVTSGCS